MFMGAFCAGIVLFVLASKIALPESTGPKIEKTPAPFA
jgi:hypothetical protein